MKVREKMIDPVDALEIAKTSIRNKLDTVFPGVMSSIDKQIREAAHSGSIETTVRIDFNPEWLKFNKDQMHDVMSSLMKVKTLLEIYGYVTHSVDSNARLKDSMPVKDMHLSIRVSWKCPVVK